MTGLLSGKSRNSPLKIICCVQPLSVVRVKVTSAGSPALSLNFAGEYPPSTVTATLLLIFDPNILGGIIVKAITLEPRDGNPGVRIAETPAGMLNAIGLENPGVDRFLKMILPNIKDLDTPIIVNVAGKTDEEYVEVARRLQVEGIAGLELNISCPNVKEGGIAFGSDPETAGRLVRKVKEVCQVPLIVKLSPNVTDIVQMAKAVEENGADVISMINTLVGMAIDINK